jgi:hypothetical protein
VTERQSISETVRYYTETAFRPSSCNWLRLFGKIVSAILIISREYMYQIDVTLLVE